jgi:hypothetical protein
MGFGAGNCPKRMCEAHHNPSTLPLLIKCIRSIVYDYSFIRPHGSLNGATPMEVYTNQQLNINPKAFMMQSKTERIEQNRKYACRICK